MLKHENVLEKHAEAMKENLDEKSVWVEKPRLKSSWLLVLNVELITYNNRV